ncbi:MAG TPA: glycoside hydrolase family 97 N-terminal domain-containing protein, partial [Kineosporiaceae bacterium]|nr:glycoside hydrolase family 97 N-terminal domain-containing protein [Kineosporiaceae bacterium]
MNWSVSSPGGGVTLEVTLDGDGRLTYRVLRGDAEVVTPSRLGVVRADVSFDAGLALAEDGGTRRIRDVYTLRHGKRLAHDVAAEARTLLFRTPDGEALALDLRAYDEGVAFRYRFPDPSDGPRTVERELTTVTPATPGRVWAQPTQEPGLYAPAYENGYVDGVPIGTGSPGAAWDLPFLVETPGGWLLVTEAGLDASFFGSRLTGTPEGGAYGFVGPQAGEGLGVGAVTATSTTPWTLPWRVVVVAGSAGEVAASDLVTHLAEPSRIDDDGWVVPGRVSWSWWSENDSPRDLARLR